MRKLATKEILYIGNMHSQYGHGVMVIETLGKFLENRYRMHYASSAASKVLRLAQMMYAVAKLRRRISTVLIDTYSTQSFLYALAVSQLCRALSIQYITILHGGNLPDRLTRSPRLSHAVFEHAITCVAPSEYLHREFSNKGYRVVVIPNAIPISRYVYRRREVVKPNLLYVRALAEIYHPPMAIRVLGQLIEQFPEAKLCLVGPDREGLTKPCRELIDQLDLARNVIITGQLNKAEWHSASECYDIFINTSNIDNMPVSVIEAMALGIPVVSTNVGGMPDLIDHEVDGLLVQRGDVDAMTNAIIRLIKSPQLVRQLTSAARSKVKLYDWQLVGKQWFELLG